MCIEAAYCTLTTTTTTAMNKSNEKKHKQQPAKLETTVQNTEQKCTQ